MPYARRALARASSPYMYGGIVWWKKKLENLDGTVFLSNLVDLKYGLGVHSSLSSSISRGFQGSNFVSTITF
jgi:hypothetical protein